ncbi:polysaccharide biosynthesis/export family protein [Brevundimonas sp.]|uniref:polysaccharide biosynthesis/export family protein n=1 Tax=Brevundimonas sp. TaxID=1871086 RepID=UPI002FCB6D55
MRMFCLLIVAAMLSSCAGNDRNPATTTAATTIDPLALQATNSGLNEDSYRIGATDLLKITVFQVPDLSFEELRVDASGQIEMPLIGSLVAAGRTPSELAQEISQRLQVRYLQDPRVSVTVSEAASQKITIDGAVSKPGVYVMRGRTTLLQAIAMAEGPSMVADLESVAVFRSVDSRRMVAVFDLKAIRNGEAEDPVVRGDDVVVVDTSRLNAAMREVLAALPGLAVFRFF